jgi:hypothetical protein
MVKIRIRDGKKSDPGSVKTFRIRNTAVEILYGSNPKIETHMHIAQSGYFHGEGFERGFFLEKFFLTRSFFIEKKNQLAVLVTDRLTYKYSI